MQTLRYYQKECVDAVMQGLREYDRLLFTLPTGAGKTTVLAEIVRLLRLEDKTVLILAHREELIMQLYHRVANHCNLDEWDISVERASEYANNSKVVVGTVQTVINDRRLCRNFDVIILDEAHRGGAEGNLKIFDKYKVGSGTKLIGCTATPKRSDKTALFWRNIDDTIVRLEDKKNATLIEAAPEQTVFDKLVYEYNITQAIEDGYLVDVCSRVIKTKTDLRGVKSTGGDFNVKELEKRVKNAERTNLAINGWIEAGCSGMQTMVFCVTVEHANDTAKMWQQAGYNFVSVDGETDSNTRKSIIEDFKAKKIQGIVNCGLFTEGTDIPNIECVVIARPTRSWALLCQICGRGLRVLPNVIECAKGTWSIDYPVDRIVAIEQSPKPMAHIIQLIDIATKDSLCTIPHILDNPIMRKIPQEFDLEGESLIETKKLMEQVVEEDSEWVAETMSDFTPVSFRQLKVLAEHINILKRANRDLAKFWKTDGNGWKLAHVPPQYEARFKHVEGDRYATKVSFKQDKNSNEELVLNLFNQRLTSEEQSDMSHYFGAMAHRIHDAIEKHKAKKAKKGMMSIQTPRGEVQTKNYNTYERLPETDRDLLQRCRFTEAKINSMPLPKAQAVVKTIRANQERRRNARTA